MFVLHIFFNESCFLLVSVFCCFTSHGFAPRVCYDDGGVIFFTLNLLMLCIDGCILKQLASNCFVCIITVFDFLCLFCIIFSMSVGFCWRVCFVSRHGFAPRVCRDGGGVIFITLFLSSARFYACIAKQRRRIVSCVFRFLVLVLQYFVNEGCFLLSSWAAVFFFYLFLFCVCCLSNSWRGIIVIFCFFVSSVLFFFCR